MMFRVLCAIFTIIAGLFIFSQGASAEYKPVFQHSIFFSNNELRAIEAARAGTLFGVGNPGMSDAQAMGGINGAADGIDADALSELQEGIELAPREVSLGGIVYVTPDVWTVWINGLQVSPGKIPDEVVSIRVKQAQVRLRWFDRATKKIYDFTLKPHQRYNIDLDTFLPG